MPPSIPWWCYPDFYGSLLQVIFSNYLREPPDFRWWKQMPDGLHNLCANLSGGLQATCPRSIFGFEGQDRPARRFLLQPSIFPVKFPERRMSCPTPSRLPSPDGVSAASGRVSYVSRSRSGKTTLRSCGTSPRRWSNPNAHPETRVILHEKIVVAAL